MAFDARIHFIFAAVEVNSCCPGSLRTPQTVQGNTRSALGGRFNQVGLIVRPSGVAANVRPSSFGLELCVFAVLGCLGRLFETVLTQIIPLGETTFKPAASWNITQISD